MPQGDLCNLCQVSLRVVQMVCYDTFDQLLLSHKANIKQVKISSLVIISMDLNERPLM